uniref:Alcohol dehydrogenase [NADP(+)] n=1 Tax=Aceria tosichella TaxID=561515 RepID=A0A6G1SBM9_9ACAR
MTTELISEGSDELRAGGNGVPTVLPLSATPKVAKALVSKPSASSLQQQQQQTTFGLSRDEPGTSSSSSSLARLQEHTTQCLGYSSAESRLHSSDNKRDQQQGRQKHNHQQQQQQTGRTVARPAHHHHRHNQQRSSLLLATPTGMTQKLGRRSPMAWLEDIPKYAFGTSHDIDYESDEASGGPSLAQVPESSSPQQPAEEAPLQSLQPPPPPRISPTRFKQLVMHAIRQGCRHFDCAPLYGTQRLVGECLREYSGRVPRQKFFLTSKLPPNMMQVDHIQRSIRQSIDELQCSYLDLFLIHAPFATRYLHDDNHYPEDPADGNLLLDESELILENAWRKLVELKKCGLTRYIGVSNVNMEQLLRLYAIHPIDVVQNEYHIYNQNRDLFDFCEEIDAHFEAYACMGNPVKCKQESRPCCMWDPVVRRVAESNSLTVAQTIIQWIHHQPLSYVIKCDNEQQLEENLEATELAELPVEDLIELDSLDRKLRVYTFAEHRGLTRHREYPFRDHYEYHRVNVVRSPSGHGRGTSTSDRDNNNDHDDNEEEEEDYGHDNENGDDDELNHNHHQQAWRQNNGQTNTSSDSLHLRQLENETIWHDCDDHAESNNMTSVSVSSSSGSSGSSSSSSSGSSRSGSASSASGRNDNNNTIERVELASKGGGGGSTKDHALALPREPMVAHEATVTEDVALVDLATKPPVNSNAVVAKDNNTLTLSTPAASTRSQTPTPTPSPTRTLPTTLDCELANDELPAAAAARQPD